MGYGIIAIFFYKQPPALYDALACHINAIDLNLEIITDADHSILAYRHDLPADMQWMVINAGHWQFFEEESLSPELLVEVRGMIVGLNFHPCYN